MLRAGKNLLSALPATGSVGFRTESQQAGGLSIPEGVFFPLR